MINNADFVTEMKSHILKTLENLDKENITNNQLRWQFLKYKIRKFSSQFSKNLGKNLNKERINLESQLKNLGTNLLDKNSNVEY